jgi:hypothetical protein
MLSLTQIRFYFQNIFRNKSLSFCKLILILKIRMNLILVLGILSIFCLVISLIIFDYLSILTNLRRRISEFDIALIESLYIILIRLILVDWSLFLGIELIILPFFISILFMLLILLLIRLVCLFEVNILPKIIVIFSW